MKRKEYLHLFKFHHEPHELKKRKTKFTQKGRFMINKWTPQTYLFYRYAIFFLTKPLSFIWLNFFCKQSILFFFFSDQIQDIYDFCIHIFNTTEIYDQLIDLYTFFVLLKVVVSNLKHAVLTFLDNEIMRVTFSNFFVTIHQFDATIFYWLTIVYLYKTMTLLCFFLV